MGCGVGDRSWWSEGGREGCGEGLGGEERGETVVRMYGRREESILKKKEKRINCNLTFMLVRHR